jgi:hypothetical protein
MAERASRTRDAFDACLIAPRQTGLPKLFTLTR